MYVYIYIYPPTSPERRACETRYHQPTYYHLVRHPTAMTASISNSARPSSSRQPSNLGSKATAQAALGTQASSCQGRMLQIWSLIFL